MNFIIGGIAPGCQLFLRDCLSGRRRFTGPAWQGCELMQRCTSHYILDFPPSEQLPIF